VIMPAYRLAWHQLDWWRNRDFNAYLERFGENQSLDIGRRWAVHQLLRLTRDVPGDTAECGVFRGSTSYLICRANEQGRLPRTHFMFDSFAGLSEPRDVDGSYWRQGDLSVAEATARERLASCKDAVFLTGWIPTRFDEVADHKFSFVHVDVDLYEPTRDSLAFFYPRLNPGGMLVLDDYGFRSCPGATRAAEEVLSEAPEKVVALPGGGGFLIKGCATADAARLS
jgi:O-methyltransferase